MTMRNSTRAVHSRRYLGDALFARCSPLPAAGKNDKEGSPFSRTNHPPPRSLEFSVALDKFLTSASSGATVLFSDGAFAGASGSLRHIRYLLSPRGHSPKGNPGPPLDATKVLRRY